MDQLIGVTIDKHDISIAHQLPDTKGKKDRFIVKFVRREKRDEFYKSRKHLGGKKASVLPVVACEMGKSIHQDSAMYINESLTQYCSDLFGRVNKFKKEDKYKFLWTIMVRSIYVNMKPHRHLHLQHLKNSKTSSLHHNETLISG